MSVPFGPLNRPRPIPPTYMGWCPVCCVETHQAGCTDDHGAEVGTFCQTCWNRVVRVAYEHSLVTGCDRYRRPEGALGGPCLTCGLSQPEHVK